jgi:hypothetical protein
VFSAFQHTKTKEQFNMTILNGSRVPRPRQSRKARDLVARYAPLIYFDRKEPFLPLAVGYTIFTADGESPSFPRRIELHGEGRAPAAFAIEYAIWWDWDIQHLYELEHTWTYVGANGKVVFSEASWHGGFNAIVLDDGKVRVVSKDGGHHPVVYSEPGKHAFAPKPEILLDQRRAKTLTSCGERAGTGGLWVTPLFKGLLDLRKNPEVDALVTAQLKKHAFTPAFVWNKRFLVTKDLLIPWQTLFEWVPARMDWWIARLQKGNV